MNDSSTKENNKIRSDPPLGRSRRGFSVSCGNEDLVREARTRLEEDIIEDEETRAPYLNETSYSTFPLPNITGYSQQFRAFLEKELIELSSLVNLEQSGRLNWWSDLGCLQRLWPLSTSGDGNCLLHAASLTMWGLHDRLLVLRHALHHRLQNHAVQIYRRWRYQMSAEYKEQGFELTEADWSDEWSAICNLSSLSPKGSPTDLTKPACCSTRIKTISGSSTNSAVSLKSKAAASPIAPSLFSISSPAGNLIRQSEGSHSSTTLTSASPVGHNYSNASPDLFAITPSWSTRSTGGGSGGGETSEVYESLEQIHIFVLAQVIRRPIVVVADNMLRDVSGEPVQAISIGGIYLPLMEPADVCHKDPLLLTYVNSHFSALVPTVNSKSVPNGHQEFSSSDLPVGIPLVDPETFSLLPIHYVVDPGETWKWGKSDTDNKKVKSLTLDENERRSLLEKYLRTAKINLRPGSTSSLGDSVGSTSSYEEGDNNNQPAVVNKKSGKSKSSSKNKDSVANKMGSLGRNIGKQLKKALKGSSTSGHIANSNMTEGPRRQSLSGVNTQTTNYALSWEKLGTRDHLYCAIIKVKPPPRYDEMIDNYLLNAQHRFAELDYLYKQRSAAIVNRVEERLHTGAVKCATSDCSMYAGPDTDGLCSLCYKQANNSLQERVSPSMVCSTPGCDYSSSKERNGYCSQCYTASKGCSNAGCINKAADSNGWKLCELCYKKRDSRSYELCNQPNRPSLTAVRGSTYL